MSEICICDFCDEIFQTRKLRESPFLNLCSYCKVRILGKKCLNCKISIQKDENVGEPWNYYCPHCESVKLGEPNIEWIPRVNEI